MLPITRRVQQSRHTKHRTTRKTKNKRHPTRRTTNQASIQRQHSRKHPTGGTIATPIQHSIIQRVVIEKLDRQQTLTTIQVDTDTCHCTPQPSHGIRLHTQVLTLTRQRGHCNIKVVRLGLHRTKVRIGCGHIRQLCRRTRLRIQQHGHGGIPITRQRPLLQPSTTGRI